MNERCGSLRALCRGCGYELVGLDEARCPECGRGFDPGDRRSYVTVVYGGRGELACALAIALLASLAHVACMATHVNLDIGGLQMQDVLSLLRGLAVFGEMGVFLQCIRVRLLADVFVPRGGALVWATRISGVLGPGLLLIVLTVVIVRLCIGLSV